MDFEMVNVGLWSVFPPAFAIALALITKEVIFSLVLGVMSGTLIYGIASHTSILGVFYTTADLMINKVGDNGSMIVFLSLLGALVALVTRAGGSRAYGKWASRKLKTKRSASLVTGLLGILIFIDDYFNCLTVGTVMKPVTDRHKISREKLAWLIDSTAAPVCVIAPISSWSASVVSYYPTATGITGMQAFVQAIPINLYALLTIVMVFFISARKNGDFGPMLAAEKRAAEAESMHDADIAQNDDIAKLEASDKGTFLDLIIPVLMLVVFCILAMLHYGGLWDGSGKSVYDAFGDTDAGMALSLGGLCAIIVAFFMYVPRRLISFTDFFASITAGIKAMVPALVILTLAWTISGVCRDLLSTGDYVASLVRDSNMPVALIPAIMFLFACGLSFATGTSWGTFGILIPITIAVCDQVAPYLSITSLAAVMGGSVFGDHCSPISDSTILSSTGAGCRHIDHVATQIPYAVTVAGSCLVGYLIAGFSIKSLGFGGMVAVSLPVSLVMMLVLLLVLPKAAARRPAPPVGLKSATRPASGF
ncbi:MAG: Na+/H+ antiporter NhaC family protein [Spirochaetaceae bacterium]|jgi:Na+/H+ antiporter NhaC|nr:Na+/H+ antiporter NhaC family protein [Spirochaetaceae bacterium]